MITALAIIGLIPCAIAGLFAAGYVMQLIDNLVK